MQEGPGDDRQIQGERPVLAVLDVRGHAVLDLAGIIHRAAMSAHLGQPLPPGFTVWRSAYWLHSIANSTSCSAMCGRGPTTDMFPSSTFRNCGISSMLSFLISLAEMYSSACH